MLNEVARTAKLAGDRHEQRNLRELLAQSRNREPPQRGGDAALPADELRGLEPQQTQQP